MVTTGQLCAVIMIPSTIILLSTFFNLRAKRRLIRKLSRIEESFADQMKQIRSDMASVLPRNERM